MKRMSKEELLSALSGRAQGERLILREYELRDMDLTGADFSHTDFTLSSFQNVVLNDVSFYGSTVKNVLFDGCPLHGADSGTPVW